MGSAKTGEGKKGQPNRQLMFNLSQSKGWRVKLSFAHHRYESACPRPDGGGEQPFFSLHVLDLHPPFPWSSGKLEAGLELQPTLLIPK